MDFTKNLNCYWYAVLYEVTHKSRLNQHYTVADVRDDFDERRKQRRSGFKSKRRQKTVLKKYPLGARYPSVYLTHREAQCMQNFLQGATIGQTAAAMNISPRTVEYYLLKMKRKLDCHSKVELIGKIIQTEFPDIIKLT